MDIKTEDTSDRWCRDNVTYTVLYILHQSDKHIKLNQHQPFTYHYQCIHSSSNVSCGHSEQFYTFCYTESLLLHNCYYGCTMSSNH